MARLLKLLGCALLVLLPWRVRRPLLQRFFGYQLHPTSRIGLAWIFPDELIMGAGASIGPMTVAKNLHRLHLGAQAVISRGNWITGFPLGDPTFFRDEPDRMPELILGEHAAITNRHIIDCTASVHIGAFTTVAGFRSQILTHSIDLPRSRQASAPIRIGRYCFVGTDCVLLGGAVLPDYSVLGAKSLLNHAFGATHRLYGGVPAREIKEVPADWNYFLRTEGFVH